MNYSIRLIAAVGLFVVLLVSCYTPAPADPAGKPKTVSWQRAVELVNSNQVEEAFQTHALSVHLNLKDGSRAQTVEPVIDEIMRVIDRCGQKCDRIMFATE